MNMNYLGLGAIGAAVISCWKYIKEVFAKITSLFVCHSTMENPLGDVILIYLFHDHKPSRFTFKAYYASMLYVKPLERVAHCPYESIPYKGNMLFWIKTKRMKFRIPAFVSRSYGTMNLTSFRPLLSHEEFINDALDFYESGQFEYLSTFVIRHVIGKEKYLSAAFDMKKKDDDGDEPEGEEGGGRGCSYDMKQFLGGRTIRWSLNDIGEKESFDPFHHIICNQEMKELIDESHHWFTARPWFRERGIPWRRGWLIWGKPGTGKSMFAKAIAQKLNIPLYVYHITTLSDQELISNWKRMITPAVVLIEDIDTCFKGRENILPSSEGHLTFDFLLNCISGVENSDGLFVIVTSNHIEHIDPALGVCNGGGQDALIVSTRPGRIDRVIHFSYFDEEQKEAMAKRVLKDWPEEIKKVLELKGDYTPAQFQEICLEAAMNKTGRKIIIKK